MEVATAAQSPSRHQKRYVPIVAGTLGGCGLALIVGCLFYLFLRRSRRRHGPRYPIRAKGCVSRTYRDRPKHVAFDTDPLSGHVYMEVGLKIVQ